MPWSRSSLGDGAQTAKTGLAVGAAGSMAAGAIAGTIIGGPPGAIIGAIGGLLSATLGIGSALIDPERAALRESIEARGLPREYADEYATSANLTTDQLWARADKLIAKGEVERVKAIRTLLAERHTAEQAQVAMEYAMTPRSGAIPLWAPAALLAIVTLGVAILLRRRS